MTKRDVNPRTLLMGLGVLCAGLAMTSCSQSVTVPINLGSGITFVDFGGYAPGEVLPSGFEARPIPVCDTLPTRADIDNLLAGVLGGLIASLVQINRVELLDGVLSPSQGNFTSFTEFGLYWQPAPVGGVPQPRVGLGSAAAPSLSAPLTLVSSPPLDFLSLLDQTEQNPSAECPELGIMVQGRVPETVPVWDVQLHLRIVGHFGLL